MNKKAILFTLLMVVSPVVQVAASAEAMYRDIKGIVEDALTGKDNHQRLGNVYKALDQVEFHKQDMQRDIIYLHAKGLDPRLISVSGLMGLIAATFYGFGVHSYFIRNKNNDATFEFIFGSMCAIYTLYMLSLRKIELYFTKKKVEKLNAVIPKLEAMKTELHNKLAQNTTVETQ